MKALTFKSYSRSIVENLESGAEEPSSPLTPEQEKQLEKNAETMQILDGMVQAGILDERAYQSQIRDIRKSIINLTKGLKASLRDEQYMETLDKLGSRTGLQVLKALGSQGARALIAKGLTVVSSLTQLANGTLVWSMDPEYKRSEGWGLGFFPDIRAIRRMTPKGIDLGVRWQPGSMDVKIKSWKYSDHASDLEFYDEAMQWAAENIDFEDVKRKPEADAWKYYTKRTTRSRSPFNQEAHDLQIQAAKLHRLARETRASNPIQALNFSLSAWTTRRKIGELENDPEKISSAENMIFRIKQDIQELKNRNR